MTSPVYGGNKVRKLEFILGDVIKSKKSRVITTIMEVTTEDIPETAPADRLTAERENDPETA